MRSIELQQQAHSHDIRPGNDARRTGGALDALLDRVIGPRGCCLTFHRVARSEEWDHVLDPGFYVMLERLDELLGQLLRAGWDVVTIEEALRRSGANGSGPADGTNRFVNFSIDDVYRDTYELVVPVFRKHGVPVTVYVTTGIPDGGYELWWCGLETILTERDAVVLRGEASTLTLPDLATRRAAYLRIRDAWEQSDPVARHHEFCADNGYDPVELHARHAITWERLLELRDDAHVEIGAHTIMHPRIATLPAEAALAEMRGSRERLEERLGIPVPHFAFPFGRRGDCGPRDFDLAREAGFRSAATTRKGLIRAGRNTDSFRLPRNTLNGVRAGGATIQAHLTGVSGAIARIMRRD